MITLYFFDREGIEIHWISRKQKQDNVDFMILDEMIITAKNYLNKCEECDLALFVDDKSGEGFMRIHKSQDGFKIYSQSENAPET